MTYDAINPDSQIYIDYDERNALRDVLATVLTGYYMSSPNEDRVVKLLKDRGLYSGIAEKVEAIRKDERTRSDRLRAKLEEQRRKDAEEAVV